MWVGPEKEKATKNTSGKMSKKKNNTDEFRMKRPLMVKLEKKQKGQSQAAVLSVLLRCFINCNCSFFSSINMWHKQLMKDLQLFS